MTSFFSLPKRRTVFFPVLYYTWSYIKYNIHRHEARVMRVVQHETFNKMKKKMYEPGFNGFCTLHLNFLCIYLIAI